MVPLADGVQKLHAVRNVEATATVASVATSLLLATGAEADLRPTATVPAGAVDLKDPRTPRTAQPRASRTSAFSAAHTRHGHYW